MTTEELQEQIAATSGWLHDVKMEMGRVLVGQDGLVDRLLIGLLCNGHILLEGMQGLAKTLLIKSLGSALGVHCDRIQFTPDLLPSDVVGTMIFQPNTGQFTAHHGPIFANLVLADEINRAPAKVQSALLEAMQEKQVTIGGKTHALPKPFFVMATQNPVEQEGTYALPEAQMDRFIFKLLVDYPSAEEETILMERWGQVTKQPELVAVSSGEELLALRKEVDRIYVAQEIKVYILNLVRATRALAAPMSDGSRTLNFGASPRACLALYQASRALAWLRGQDHVTPELVQEVFPDALRHRINLTYEAEAADLNAEKVLQQILAKEPVPTVGVKAA
ncbi:MAG: ATPase [Burkholderiales bacterium PBB4]|nr:MAG: ATPase [Burkholderiales bacterium PBB4]